MAYQPKSYRKFLATSVTAALVAGSVVAPAAAASNFNDQIPNWAADAVDYLVGKGAIEGKPGNVFDPHGNLTRAEAAKILAVALELDIDENAKTDFADAANHWGSPYIAAIQDQLPGVIDGYNGQFRPNDSITRQELAKMVAEAYNLEEDESANVSFNDNNGWGQEYVNILASLGIVQGKSANRFAPNDKVTRAETAVFVHRTEVPSARVITEETVLRITEVKGLDDTNRFLQITFSQRVNSLEPSDITIENAKSKERYGVKEVNLSSNGLVAQVELFSHEGREIVLDYLTDYNVTVKANGRTLEYVFNRPLFIENYVTEINPIDKKFTIYTNTGNTRTIEVTKDFEDFDFQTLLGEKVGVWIDDKDRLVDYTIYEENAKYDSIEITKANEVKLLTEDKKYDFSDDTFRDKRDKEVFTFYVNGEQVKKEDYKDYVGKKFNYAKVGFDDSGDVIYISAYNLDQFLIVDKVEGNEVVGIEGDGTGGAYNAKDATIIKDGKVISKDDLEKGDILFYNTKLDGKKKFAEVYNNSIKGEIETVFYDAVRVKGETYDFIIDEENINKFGIGYGKAVYIKKDGKTDYVDHKAAEELQAAGETSLYFDRAGNVVYIGGDLAKIERNDKVSILTADIKTDNRFQKDLIQIEVVTEDGKEALHQLTLEDLDTISVNGVEYDIEKTPEGSTERSAKVVGDNIVLTDENGKTISIPLTAEGKLVTVNYNKDGKVTGLEFFLSNSVNNGKEGFASFNNADNALEPGDKYINGKRLLSSTVVFDATDGYKKSPVDIKPGDVTVTTWGEYNGSDIAAADFIYNDKNDVVALVIKQTTTSDQVYEEAVITQVLRNTDKEIVEIRAFVNGVEERLQVDKLRNPVNLNKGDVAVLEFSKNNKKLVKAILTNETDKNQEFAKRVVVGDVEEVRVGSREVVINGTTYRLVSDGAVINATDKDKIETKALTDLRGKKDVIVVLDEKTGSFAKYFVYGGKVELNGDKPTPKEVKVDPIKVGKEITFTASSLADGTNLSFVANSAESSNKNVATVAINNDGKLVVKAVAVGESTITVDVTNGNAAVEVKFVVTVEEDGESVFANLSARALAGVGAVVGTVDTDKVSSVVVELSDGTEQNAVVNQDGSFEAEFFSGLSGQVTVKAYNANGDLVEQKKVNVEAISL